MTVRRRRRARMALGALIVVAGVAVAGCSAVRNDLGTSNSDCYVDLAAASGALHGAGHLQGVRLVDVPSLRSVGTGALYRAVTSARPRATRVCLVAYTGRFRSGRVSHPIGASTGRLAVVAVTYPGKRVVATLITSRPPFPFAHTHIGLAAAPT